jgi:hypothetical protein
MTGNYQNAQTSILILIVAGYFAHQSGLDKKAYEKGKDVVDDVKARVKKFRDDRARNHLKSVD